MNTTPKKPTPKAPAVYRPQATPRVLQTKVVQLAPCKHGNNKKTCKHCKQSQQDRNVNKFVAYQTPNKKTIEQDVEKVKELKTNLAHGSKNSNYGQSGKTKKIFQDLNQK